MSLAQKQMNRFVMHGPFFSHILAHSLMPYQVRNTLTSTRENKGHWRICPTVEARRQFLFESCERIPIDCMVLHR
jgi:hypothetical protein